MGVLKINNDIFFTRHCSRTYAYLRCHQCSGSWLLCGNQFDDLTDAGFESADLLFIQQIIREDAHLLFGFNTRSEKEMFNLLISVNGVGAVSALILLSTLSLDEIASAILSGNSALIQKQKELVQNCRKNYCRS